jgi:hypothetical protein
MCIETFFESYKSTIGFLGSLGTLVAAAVAICVVRQNSKDLRRIRLSGLSVKEVDSKGVLYLQNNTDVDLIMTTSINKGVIDENCRNEKFQEIISSNKWINNEFVEINKDIVLSKGEVLVIHLKNIVVENAYISLVALKVQFSDKEKSEFGKAKYFLFRYAGDLAKSDKVIGSISHPHNKWIMECAKSE